MEAEWRKGVILPMPKIWDEGFAAVE